MVKKFLIITMRTISEHIAKILTMVVVVGTDNAGQPIYINPNRVVIANQPNFVVPEVGLFITIQVSNQQLVNTNKAYQTQTGFKESIGVDYLSSLAIEFFSKDDTAFNLKDLLPLYLESYGSRDYQNQNNFTIEPLGQSFFDLSSLEGADRINRFRYEYKVFHGVSITNDIPYYDNNFTPSTIIT
jgi:hypothetical protein